MIPGTYTKRSDSVARPLHHHLPQQLPCRRGRPTSRRRGHGGRKEGTCPHGTALPMRLVDPCSFRRGRATGSSASQARENFHNSSANLMAFSRTRLTDARARRCRLNLPFKRRAHAARTPAWTLCGGQAPGWPWDSAVGRPLHNIRV